MLEAVPGPVVGGGSCVVYYGDDEELGFGADGWFVFFLPFFWSGAGAGACCCEVAVVMM